jgi:hypothetical protein
MMDEWSTRYLVTSKAPPEVQPKQRELSHGGNALILAYHFRELGKKLVGNPPGRASNKPLSFPPI